MPSRLLLAHLRLIMYCALFAGREIVKGRPMRRMTSLTCKIPLPSLLAGMVAACLLAAPTAANAAPNWWWPFGNGNSEATGSTDQITATPAAATGSAAASTSIASISPVTAPVATSSSPADKSSPSPAEEVRIHVVDIAVRGNLAVTDEQILLALPLHRGEDVSRQQVTDAMQRIYGMGYFMDVKAFTEPLPGGLRLILEVVEHPKLEKVQLSGITVFSPAEIEKNFEPLVGSIINLRDIQKLVKDLEKRYAEQGYILARVVDLQVQPSGILQIKIAEGQIEALKIMGNEETRDYVIRREITLQAGQLFNFKKMEEDLRRVYNLNYFEDIRLKYEPGSTLDKVVVIVDVKEKQTGMFQLSAGYSNRDGPLGVLSLRKDNLLGRGQSISADFTISRNPSAELSYFNPWIDSQHTSLGLSVYDRRYANFLNQALVKTGNILPDGQPETKSTFSQEERRGGVLSVGRPLFGDPVTANWRGTLSLKNEWINIQRDFGRGKFENSPEDTVSRHGSGTDWAISLGTGFTHDSRDLIINPSTGWFNSLSFEQYLGPVLGDLDLTRINLEANRYLPVWPDKCVLAFGIRSATTLSLFKQRIPSYERFYSTGLYLVRGWPENIYDSLYQGDAAVLVKGDSLALGSLEYRFPIWNIVSGVVFADTGIFWDQQARADSLNAFNLSHLRSGYGVGVRVNTPLGPLRLDLGTPGWKPGQPLRIYPHFSIGQKF
ncbi:MAG: BamA/TamA family outer membrane protein [Cyanobacteria bacterium NC_groundwater_1444_Ag_S-0.65um_54_12]|nr:BamA/TamA family outer membrane protein [Cyanobacteria bacterium NC_groundwater_1444_Ag_S-0.65um_54_12]